MARVPRAQLFPALHRHISNTMYGLLRRSGAAQWHRRAGAMVFCYHNVVPDALAGRIGERWLHTGVSDFREQIAWVADAYTVVPLRELLTRLRQGRSLRRLAALTFDDGYIGVLRHAVPVLRAASLPFTLFPVASTATTPRPFWWDHLGPLHSSERDRLLSTLKGDAELIGIENALSSEIADDGIPASWDELRTVLGPDCEIGVHTVTHRNLTPLTPDEIAWELTHARSRLVEELGVYPQTVAYPYGGVSEEVFTQMRKAKFEAGFGLDFGLIRSGADPLNLPRVNVPAGMHISSFACWGSGLKLRF